MRLGLQLYTVRDALASNFQGTLEAVSKLGFQGVEFAGNYGGMTPTELSDFLNTLKLKVAGMHVSLEALTDDLETQVNTARVLGAPRLVCPWIAEARYANGWGNVIAALVEIKHELEGSGVGLAYHNHVFEFEQRVGDLYALDAIAAAGIDLEFDIAWGHAGGVNPAAYLHQHTGRVPLLHVKDILRNASGWDTVSLGDGEVPLSPTLEAARGAGVQWLILEQDHCPGDALESVNKSMVWWNAHVR
jgi:sugar phosphate isomerase/epimerase